MDPGYREKLEQATLAPDSAFPHFLFEPLCNDFGDNYFTMELEDFGSNAAKVDPRFTQKNIKRMRGSTKRVDTFLEWISLWDDYMEYLTETYGSPDIAAQMAEAGTIKDPMPTIDHRPLLRKGKDRRMLKRGIIPSYMASGIDPLRCYDKVYSIIDEMEEDEKGFHEEPDIDYAFKQGAKGSFSHDIMAKNTTKYKRMKRLETLNKGTGITAGFDFVDHYYTNTSRGLYDTQFSPDDKGDSLTAMMRKDEDRRYWHEGKILSEAQRGPKYSFSDGVIRENAKQELMELYKYMYEHAGIDVLGTMAGRVSKKSYKAIRRGMEMAGVSFGLTEKERKKLKKKQRKLEDMGVSRDKADAKLRDVLLNNKIFMNSGTRRFEDMRRVGYDDDDD